MPRTDESMMIRYDGDDYNRVFCIQRGDTTYWTGNGWSEDYIDAKLYEDHRTAQLACNAIQYERHAGKPIRQFKVAMTITLADPDVQEIAREEVIDFLAKAMRIDLETPVFGEGPREESYTQARVHFAKLKEIRPNRKTL